MTISNISIRKAGPSQGNGVNTAFPFTFKVFTTADVLVTYLNASGVELSLTLNIDYSVSLNTDQNASPGGTVNLYYPPAIGTYITLTSQVTNTQNLTLTNSGGFYPQSINDALDRCVIQIQQLAEQLSRTFKISVSSIGSPGSYIGDYLAQAAASAASAMSAVNSALISATNSAASATSSAASATSSAASATSSATSATSSATSAISSAASALVSSNAAVAATIPTAKAIATYIDNYFPPQAQVTFSSIYVSGGWDMGNITTPTFTNESSSRCVNLASDATASFNFGTVP